MAAIDFIQDRRVKKLKYTDMPWKVTGSGYTHQLILNGELQSGTIDWTRSRYLKVGHDQCFFAWVSGSDHYKILAEEKRDGYVAPKDFAWKMMPVQVEEDDE